jgi:hypothetical protein
MAFTSLPSAHGHSHLCRIGDITAQVSGGKLHMACNISTLTADPQFGPWPNEFNALAISSRPSALLWWVVSRSLAWGLQHSGTDGL